MILIECLPGKEPAEVREIQMRRGEDSTKTPPKLIRECRGDRAKEEELTLGCSLGYFDEDVIVLRLIFEGCSRADEHRALWICSYGLPRLGSLTKVSE